MPILYFLVIPQLTDILFHFLFLFLGYLHFTDKLVIKFSISSNFFSTDFVKFFIVSISFKNMFWREIKLWVLSLYTEGSRGVCWVSGIITISWLATKLSETEDVQSIWVFLTKLEFPSLSSCASLSLSSCASFYFIL